MRCGVSVREFGELTPRELFLIVDNYNEQRQQLREDYMTQAYLTAHWQRAKRMPSLKKVLEDAKPKNLEPQSDDQMFAAVKGIHAKLVREEE